MIHRAVRAQTERGIVTVTLIDDLHWIDAGSDAFVAQLVEAFEGSRSLLLLNFRPEYEADWTRRGHYQQLPLVPLGSEAVRELVVSLLGTDPSVRGLPERIERWTAGNPFFTEEVIQTLIEGEQLVGSPGAYQLTTDLERLEVPSSVQAVLAARIDRLPELAKHVLQTAAVIGKEFSGPILSDVAELPEVDLAQALDRLKTGDFVYERVLYPVADYAFKHPLSHEVAYESQLQDRKAGTHAPHKDQRRNYRDATHQLADRPEFDEIHGIPSFARDPTACGILLSRAQTSAGKAVFARTVSCPRP